MNAVFDLWYWNPVYKSMDGYLIACRSTQVVHLQDTIARSHFLLDTDAVSHNIVLVAKESVHE